MLIRLYDGRRRDLYMQLADEIIRLMAEGELKVGDELPSIRKLASSLQVNTKTVQTAYQKLADEGFILLRKKATAIVSRENFHEENWLERWGENFTLFHNECKARNLSDDEITKYLKQLLKSHDG